MSGFSSIDARALADLLAQSGPLEIVDVRNPDEVVRGAINGSRHIPLAQLPQRFQELERDRAIVFYCQSGVRSMQASAFLAARGWSEVFSLSGGVMAWVRSGLPLSAPNQGEVD